MFFSFLYGITMVVKVTACWGRFTQSSNDMFAILNLFYQTEKLVFSLKIFVLSSQYQFFLSDVNVKSYIKIECRNLIRRSIFRAILRQRIRTKMMSNTASLSPNCSMKRLEGKLFSKVCLYHSPFSLISFELDKIYPLGAFHSKSDAWLQIDRRSS